MKFLLTPDWNIDKSLICMTVCDTRNEIWISCSDVSMNRFPSLLYFWRHMHTFFYLTQLCKMLKARQPIGISVNINIMEVTIDPSEDSWMWSECSAVRHLTSVDALVFLAFMTTYDEQQNPSAPDELLFSDEENCRKKSHRSLTLTKGNHSDPPLKHCPPSSMKLNSDPFLHWPVKLRSSIVTWEGRSKGEKLLLFTLVLNVSRAI